MKVIASLVAFAAATAVAAPGQAVKPRTLKDDSAPHQDDPNFISAVMRAHWYWRRLHCAQDLVWSTELADAARADIETCTQKPKHVRQGS
jgi:uncharacterized protein YkwD